MNDNIIKRNNPTNIIVVSNNKRHNDLVKSLQRFGSTIQFFDSEMLTNIKSEDYHNIWKNIDGIVLPGGTTPVEFRTYKDQPRDPSGSDFTVDLNWKIIALEAMSKNIPLFTICRGMLLLNEAMGGTIKDGVYQNHSKHSNTSVKKINKDGKLYHSHEVVIQKDTKLNSVIFPKKQNKNNTITTNSNHGHCVDILADEFIVNARCKDDDVIEGIEYKDLDEKFVIGIQWHAETMFNKTNDFNSFMIFNWFIEATHKYAARRFKQDDVQNVVANNPENKILKI